MDDSEKFKAPTESLNLPRRGTREFAQAEIDALAEEAILIATDFIPKARADKNTNLEQELHERWVAIETEIKRKSTALNSAPGGDELADLEKQISQYKVPIENTPDFEHNMLSIRVTPENCSTIKECITEMEDKYINLKYQTIKVRLQKEKDTAEVDLFDIITILIKELQQSKDFGRLKLIYEFLQEYEQDTDTSNGAPDYGDEYQAPEPPVVRLGLAPVESPVSAKNEMQDPLIENPKSIEHTRQAIRENSDLELAYHNYQQAKVQNMPDDTGKIGVVSVSRKEMLRDFIQHLETSNPKLLETLRNEFVVQHAKNRR